LVDFRERIKINGGMIDKNYVVSFVKNNKKIIEQLTPSFFEITVSMAFNYFADENVDIAIIEVGLGGRLDSTNIITPILSIITNIGYDHTNFLGDTLEEIASEKAGIIKKEIPIVIGEDNSKTLPVFKNIASNKNAPIYLSRDLFRIESTKETIDYQEILVINKESNKTDNLLLDLKGEYQRKNVLTVLSAFEVLKNSINISQNNIKSGLSNVIKNTGLRGRWEIVNQSPKTICDTGHNKEGIIYIVNQLKKQEYKKLHIVFGTTDEKDIKHILPLFPQDAKFYFTQANIPRAKDSADLLNQASQIGFNGTAYRSVKESYLSAIKNANFDDIIFVGGSTFVVADLFLYLNEKI
jgi:dihydrofolate synthase/folylpolyglutamate synthase